MNYEIRSIFPDPLYSSTFEITQEQINFVKNLEYTQNVHNSFSKNKFVLDYPELKSLKNFIELHLNSYYKNILGAGDELKPFITQSWVNRSFQNEFHHPHTHSNCNVSGVFYIEVNEGDRLCFSRRNNLYHKIYPKVINEFNAFELFVPVKNNLLYLFPQDVYHRVPENENNKPRYSLAFNGFAKGKWGDIENLTYLEI
jgi:uncharacterized protein (TIGR02466 family)